VDLAIDLLIKFVAKTSDLLYSLNEIANIFINNCCYREAMEIFKNRKIVESIRSKPYNGFNLQKIDDYKDEITINILEKMTEGIDMKKLAKNKIETKIEPVVLSEIEL
jgi:rRNA-processing protein FCF1